MQLSQRRTTRGTPTRAPPTRPTRSSTRSPDSSSAFATARCPASPPIHRSPTSWSSVATTSSRWHASTTPPESATRRVTPTSSTSMVRTSARSARATSSATIPYGDLDPIEWATRRLYVPELALGRLVESPAQIIAQIDAFGAASGRLDASRAYAAGYDFMTDGASMVRQTLDSSLASANGAPATVTGPTRTTSTWTGNELLADIAGPPAPSISAIFAPRRPHRHSKPPNGDEVFAAALAAAVPDWCTTDPLDGVPLRASPSPTRRSAAVRSPTTSPRR